VPIYSVEDGLLVTLLSKIDAFMNWIKTFTVTFCLLATSMMMGQNFEGIIEFSRKNYFDETKYIYYVSSSMVRIDELDKEGEVNGTMLVNLKSKEVTAINHERKLHMEIKSKPSVKDLSKSEIFKTNEKKEVLGHSCVKWTVSNPDFKSKAEYWVVEKADYFFFKELLTALNRKDKVALYFMQIPENTGYFPIIGEEKGLDGKLKSRLETTKLIRTKVSASKFKIPEGYQEFMN
jgi:hypothetical protein